MRMTILAATLFLLTLVAGAGYWWLSKAVHEPLLHGQWLQRSVQVGDRERGYGLYLPEKTVLSPPLVLVLHGSMSNGEAIRRQTQYGFDRLADAHGFVVAYPDGFDGHWNDCRKIAPYEARQQNIDDVGFLQALIDQVSARHRIDPGKVLLVGYSNGGHLAFRVAFEKSELAAAIAVIGANLPAPGYSVCPDASVSVSALVVNGRRDPINPYDGGDVSLFGFGNRGQVLSSAETIAGLGASTAVEKAETNAFGKALVETWTTSDARLLRLVTLSDGGHTIPTRRGRMPRLLGPTNRDLETADLIWGFFQQSQGQAPARRGQVLGATVE